MKKKEIILFQEKKRKKDREKKLNGFNEIHNIKINKQNYLLILNK